MMGSDDALVDVRLTSSAEQQLAALGVTLEAVQYVVTEGRFLDYTADMGHEVWSAEVASRALLVLVEPGTDPALVAGVAFDTPSGDFVPVTEIRKL